MLEAVRIHRERPSGSDLIRMCSLYKKLETEMGGLEELECKPRYAG